MRDVIDKLDTWREQGEKIAIATVIETWGSAPRPPGSKLVISERGGIAGSVSAGCVEGAVILEAREVLRQGIPRVLEYGVADETAWGVGLACGGTIKIFVEPGFALNSLYPVIKKHLRKKYPFALVSVLKGSHDLIHKKCIVNQQGDVEGDLIISGQMNKIINKSRAFISSGKSGVFDLPAGVQLFIEGYPPPPRLIVIGAVHFSDPLITMANAAGFDTILIDPRPAFATAERFPHVGKIMRAWPHEVLPDLKIDSSTFVVLLTHDPKIDDPALQLLLRSSARYIGALGSRKTHQKRVERLLDKGLTSEEISRLHAPIGLDLGGETPGEVAISIMAEIVQEKNNQ